MGGVVQRGQCHLFYRFLSRAPRLGGVPYACKFAKNENISFQKQSMKQQNASHRFFSSMFSIVHVLSKTIGKISDADLRSI